MARFLMRKVRTQVFNLRPYWRRSKKRDFAPTAQSVGRATPCERM